MSVLSVYASPWHRYPQYLAYVAALQPAWVRLHQPQAQDVSDLQRVAPQANIMLRSWDIDDNNGARKRELYDDPRGAALRLIDRWEEMSDALQAELRAAGKPFDRSRWYFGTWNEPDPAYVPQIVEGNREAMRLAGLRGMRLGVVCSSVGNFAKPEEGPHGWTACKPLEPAIRDGGHILICHEYWQREGPAGVWTDERGVERHDAGNLAWRHRSIPLDVPILIGESGPNGYIFGRMSGQDDCGWQRMMSADQYAAQVREYIAGCDTRVQGVCLYMTDYHSDQWASFDTLPAHQQLLAVADAQPQMRPPFAAPTGPTISAPAGANVRALPSTQADIVRRLPFAAAVLPVAVDASGDWLLLHNGGWVYATLVASAPVSLPVAQEVHLPIVAAPEADSECWAKSLAFVLRWEGGWADNPNDPGGATMKGITIGTYTRWRAARGQPAPSKEELRAISDAEVEAIYREWYWLESGAEALAWPLCLAHFNLAVNAGPGRARQTWQAAGPDFLHYMATALEWYASIGNFEHFGRAWVRRCADVLRQAAA